MMTLWSDIVGYTCVECGKWATHFYGDAPICCTCHCGSVDEYMERKAIEINDRYQKGLPLESDNDVPSIDLAEMWSEEFHTFKGGSGYDIVTVKL